jgi:hypothetical protein
MKVNLILLANDTDCILLSRQLFSDAFDNLLAAYLFEQCQYTLQLLLLLVGYKER